jgi:transposase
MEISGSRLKEKTRIDWRSFCRRVTARSATDLARINRKMASDFFHRLRQIIARQLEDSLPVEGFVEVEESYFGGVHKGKRGRGAAGTVPIFGIFTRGGIVTTVMMPECPQRHTPSCLPAEGCSGFDRLYRLLPSL